MYSPTDIAQEALDSAGIDFTIGDIESGSRFAQVCARKYRPCLTSLLRAARWQFARKQMPLQILGDVTQTYTQSVLVIPPWLYEYALPNDCLQAHFVPFAPQTNVPVPQGNISVNTALPVSPALATTPGSYPGMLPARFLISRDVNYPPIQGQNWWEVQGQSPMGQTVVLTNVPQAQLVYTSLVLYPSEWDSLFREALVAYLASEVALILHTDKKLGLTVRAQQIAIAKEKLTIARIADANEGINVNDHVPDWLQARQIGRGGFGWAGGALDGGMLPGVYYSGWSPIAFADGGPAF